MDALLAKTMAGLPGFNTLVEPSFAIRFQIAPGPGSGLGIAGADYQILNDGTVKAQGTTNSDGEALIPLRIIFEGATTFDISIFGMVYSVELQIELAPLTNLQGQQKRLDILGYMSGYQLSAIGNDTPDDGIDGPRTQQSIMNFQCDQDISIDGDIGPQTTQALRQAIGE